MAEGGERGPNVSVFYFQLINTRSREKVRAVSAIEVFVNFIFLNNSPLPIQTAQAQSSLESRSEECHLKTRLGVCMEGRWVRRCHAGAQTLSLIRIKALAYVTHLAAMTICFDQGKLREEVQGAFS